MSEQSDLIKVHECDEIAISYDPELHIFDLWIHSKGIMLLLDDSDMTHLLSVLSSSTDKILELMPDEEDESEIEHLDKV